MNDPLLDDARAVAKWRDDIDDTKFPVELVSAACRLATAKLRAEIQTELELIRTNCIFTFCMGQEFRDIDLPLAYGEGIVRATLLACAQSIRPIRANGKYTPSTHPVADRDVLSTVSMCIPERVNEPEWYAACNGKLHFR